MSPATIYFVLGIAAVAFYIAGAAQDHPWYALILPLTVQVRCGLKLGQIVGRERAMRKQQKQ